MGVHVHIPIRIEVGLDTLAREGGACGVESTARSVAHVLERAQAALERDGRAAPAVFHPLEVGWLGAPVPAETRHQLEEHLREVIAQQMKVHQARASSRVALEPPARVIGIGEGDLLLVFNQGRALVMPARPFVLQPPPRRKVEFEPRPFLEVPTVGKGGLRMVRTDGQVGFLVDMGGHVPRKGLLSPRAVVEIPRALGVETLSGAVILHIHEDHIGNMEHFIRYYRIRPENIRFPQAFETSGLRFGTEIIQKLRTTKDAELVSLGYGRGEATPFRFIPVPGAEGATSTRSTERVFREQFTEGGVQVELFGLTGAITRLGSAPTSARPLTAADVDRGSLLMRLTQKETGVTVLLLSDLRGEYLRKVRDEMGAGRFRQMLANVRVLEAFHHLGALNVPGDPAGLELLLREILSQQGRLDIIAQTQTGPYGRQPYGFLNRSLVEALRQLGVNVHIAAEASAGLGTITVDQLGNVQVSGSGTQSVLGDVRIQQRLRQFSAMTEAIGLMRANRELLRTSEGGPIDPRLAELEEARLQLGRSLGLLGDDGLLQRVLAGVGTGAKQARGQLTNQPQVDALIQASLRVHPGEKLLESHGFPELMEDLRREGPLRRRVVRELHRMRQTGAVSRELIESLGELNPELARRLLASARLPRETRQQLEQHLASAGAPPRVRTRVTAGVLVLVDLLSQVGPLVQQARASAYSAHVLKFLDIIHWWQQKGVVPQMKATFDVWFRQDTTSTDPNVIGEMLKEGKVDYLALMGIESESQWDLFNIWMVQHVRNFNDYHAFVPDSDRWNAPLKWEGASWASAEWKYRAGSIEPTLTGYTLKETWCSHPRLNTIMRAVVRQVIETTQRELERAWTERGRREAPGAELWAAGTYINRPVLAFEQPLRRVRFKKDASRSERRAWTVATRDRVLNGDDYYSEPVFYVLDSRLAGGEVDPEYLLVTGADYNTYARLVQVESARHVIEDVNGRTWPRVEYRADNPSGQVLILRSAVEDF